MGSVRIDLSAANERRQDEILIRDERRPDPTPPATLDHYWGVVDAYREHDLRETGTTVRFDHHHRWVAAEFTLIADKEASFARTHQSPRPRPTTLSTPPVSGGAVPEPSSGLSLAIAVVAIAWWFRWR